MALWNARAAGLDPETVVHVLITYSRFPVPHSLLTEVAETMGRYGRLQLLSDPAHGLVLHTTDVPVLEEVLRSRRTAGMLGERLSPQDVVAHPSERGNLKQALITLGWPAAFRVGDPSVPFTIDAETLRRFAPVLARAVPDFRKAAVPPEKRAFEVIDGTMNIGVRGLSFEALFSKNHGGLISYRYGGKELLKGIVRPNFWRAPTDNDRGNRWLDRKSVV